jgi:hypothetical protein
MEFLSAPEMWHGRWLFIRGLAALYLIAFLSARNQFPALLGEHGLLPVPRFLKRTGFRTAPSLFHAGYSDRLFGIVAWTGILLSAAVLVGLFSQAPPGVAAAVWLILWFVYLSIVNVGQRFYSFGWETMLTEAGFFAAFLAPAWTAPSWIPIVLLRWMLFRVEVGAGLIKLRAGGPWHDLTALDYHHETQPMPNPLSWFAHHLPRPLLHAGVVFSHVVQVAAPFGLFVPQPVAGIAAALIIVHQLILIIAGNYAWLNWLTVVLAFSALPSSWLGPVLPVAVPAMQARPVAVDFVQMVLAGIVVGLSVPVVRNLLSSGQLMNYSYNSLRLVNTYGAFGSVTKTRYEIVIEGTTDDPDDPRARWHEYEFKGKPGDPARRPPQVAPYHLRLDWLMWFLPLAVMVTPSGIVARRVDSWYPNFIRALLDGDRKTIRLLKHNPFPDAPPQAIRSRFYRYRFTDRRERRESGRWWTREYIDDYTRPVRRGEL